jgi:hypothetical protein
MAAARKVEKKTINTKGVEADKDSSGVTFIRVLCTDGRKHRYLTADIKDLIENPPKTPEETPAACSSCGLAMSELRGRTVQLCSECRWDAAAERIESFMEESGIALMPSAPDHVQLRMRSSKSKPSFYRKIVFG